MPKKQDLDKPYKDENHMANGCLWEPTTVNVKINGQSNYILTKLKLLHPNVAKTLLAKQILEKALLEVDSELSKFKL